MTPADSDETGIGPDEHVPTRRRDLRPWAFVIVLTLVAILFALIVAVWMYWIVGLSPA